MTIVAISSITIPANRQRREHDEKLHQELINSLTNSAFGLLHPLVVRDVGGGYHLVAGERRLRAIREATELGFQIRYAGEILPLGMAPITDIGDMDPVDAFEAELEENLRRKDLTFIEQAQAVSRLMDLRLGQAAKAGRQPPTVGSVAREIFDIPLETKDAALGQARDTVKNQLIVARHAADPEVRKAGSLKEAVKLIKAKEEKKKNSELAAILGEAYSKSSQLKLYNQNCLEFLAGAEEKWDVILTDPPYGMGADTFGDSGRAGNEQAHEYEDSRESWLTLMEELPKALFRAAAETAHAYLFCDPDNFAILRQEMMDAGWKVFRTPLIWHKPNGYRAPWPDHGPQRAYEMILYAMKGQRKVNKMLGDVLSYSADVNLGHSAQKPVALLTDLLQRSARPNSRVLDPFAGTGSVAVACHEMKLPCTSIELDPVFFGLAARRLESLSSQPTLL